MPVVQVVHVLSAQSYFQNTYKNVWYNPLSLFTGGMGSFGG